MEDRRLQMHFLKKEFAFGVAPEKAEKTKIFRASRLVLAPSAKFELKKKHKKNFARRVLYLRLLQNAIRIRKAAEKKFALRAWCSRLLLSAS